MPTGELPNNLTLMVDRHLVGKIAPGTRVNAVGIYSIYEVSPQSHMPLVVCAGMHRTENTAGCNCMSLQEPAWLHDSLHLFANAAARSAKSVL